jgi:copper(I)-binding protein
MIIGACALWLGTQNVYAEERDVARDAGKVLRGLADALSPEASDQDRRDRELERERRDRELERERRDREEDHHMNREFRNERRGDWKWDHENNRWIRGEVIVEKPPYRDEVVVEKPRRAAAGEPSCDTNANHFVFQSPPVALTDPRMRPAQRRQNTAAFLDIENQGARSLDLIEARSSVADAVELHRSFEQRGIQKMRSVDRITIESDNQVSLKPGGFHIMLIGLKKTLRMGDRIPVRLIFNRGPEVTVYFVVKRCCSACH